MSTKPFQKARSGVFTTGLALFSMFFGAGNLIFPLLIGKSVGSNIWFAIAGLGLTAVLIPLSGLMVMLLFQADCRLFFNPVGKIPGFLLLLLLQLILGPFGVIPRLVTLMHALAGPYLFDMPLFPFTLLIAGALFFSSLKQHRLIPFLGTIFTPILLLSLAALVLSGLWDASPMQASSASPIASFTEGLLGGYNTMDLIAAFLFATVVLPYFHKEHPGKNSGSLFRKMALSNLIAAFLLFLTYIGLCLISAHHGWTLSSHPPEQMLSVLATKLLGSAGSLIAAIAVLTACLTTAMTLASIFADYLRKDLCQERIDRTPALLFTLAAATLFANLGFQGIASFLSPLLQIVYPGLILLALFNLFRALIKEKVNA